jgi:hypothetical protein
MALDVIKIHRGCNTGQLVDVAHITRQVLIVLQALAIALEMPVINRVEADQGGEQANTWLVAKPARYTPLLIAG